VRVGYSDLIGSERGRDVLVDGFARTAEDGLAFCRSVYGTTPMGDVVPIEGGLDAGLPDVVAFPDCPRSNPSPGSQGWRTASPTSTTPTGRRRR
jgi:glutamine synthetase